MGCIQLSILDQNYTPLKVVQDEVSKLRISHRSKLPKNKDDAGLYRFGFNGMERDDELKGSGNSLDLGARVYDSRLGKFMSMDPKYREYPMWSPYLFAGNKPTWMIDQYGLGPVIVNGVFVKWEVEPGDGLTQTAVKINQYLESQGMYNGESIVNKVAWDDLLNDNWETVRDAGNYVDMLDMYEKGYYNTSIDPGDHLDICWWTADQGIVNNNDLVEPGWESGVNLRGNLLGYDLGGSAGPLSAGGEMALMYVPLDCHCYEAGRWISIGGAGGSLDVPIPTEKSTKPSDMIDYSFNAGGGRYNFKQLYNRSLVKTLQESAGSVNGEVSGRGGSGPVGFGLKYQWEIGFDESGNEPAFTFHMVKGSVGKPGVGGSVGGVGLSYDRISVIGGPIDSAGVENLFKDTDAYFLKRHEKRNSNKPLNVNSPSD